MVNTEVNNGKNNEINSMEDSFVRSLLNKEPKKEEPNDETENKSEVQPVRYKGGETAEDVKGNTITRPASGIDKFLGSLQAPYADGAPRPKVDQVPIKAKENEPEYGYEWAEEAASRVWDSGKSLDEVEKDMNKDYPLAAARIKEATENLYKYEKNKKTPPYHKSYSYIADGEGREESIYIDPKDQAEITIANRYGFMLDDTDPLAGLYNPRPSEAARLINSNKKLKKAWQEYNDLNYNNPAESNNRYSEIHQLLTEMGGTKSLKELKKLGFSSQDDYNNIIDYLQKSLKTIQVRQYNYRHPNKNDSTKVTDTGTQPTSVYTKEDLSKSAETIAAENAEEAKKDQEEEERKKRVAERSQAKNAAPEDTIEAKATTDTGYEATLTNLTKEQEEKAFKEAEELANREKSRKEAEAEEKEIDKAAREAQQNKLDYEEWIKNPTLISGIFGKSGLSTARRVGLGLATLFSIFSDVAANYGKGIKGDTDFKTEAMDALNSTIKTIQDKRANSIGDMAAAPYGVTTENDKKLLKDIEKIKNLPLGRYVADEGTLRGFIQEAQITTEPLSEDYYNRFSDALREGYINSIKNTPSQRYAYLDENGNLNDYGELQFLKKKKNAIENLGNIIEKSDERLSNINKLLDIDEKNAKVKSTVHDAFFNTNADYINAIRVLQDENRALEQSKLELTEAKTLDQMLESAGKFKNTVSGLSTSTSNSAESESNTEAAFNRYVESEGREEVNRELEKHGWQAELNGEASAGFPIKVVPISAEIKAGGKWTNEQAQEYIDTWKTNKQKEFQDQLTKVKAASSASGTTIDAAAQAVYNFLNTEKAKGAEADFNKARENAIRAIDEKINYNNTAIEKLQEMQNTENKGKYSTSSTDNPYISMYNDVPTKNSEWYKHMLALS